MNGTELGVQEWRDALFLMYGLEPPDLPKYFDGCNAKFTIFHALNYKIGGLVTERHNELWDGITDLAGKDFTPSHVFDDPLIFSGCAAKSPKAKPVGPIASTDRGGALPP